MSSDLFVFDASFFTDPFSSFSDSPIDILQENPVDETNSFDQITPTLLPSSPPSHQLENLSLCQTTNLENASNSANGYADFSVLEVKTEEFQIPFYSYGGSENSVKMMQRSYSSNSFDGKPNFLFQPCFNSLMESPNFQTQVLSSPENNFSTGQMRRVCSTGDLQNTKTTQRLSSSTLARESSFMEEANSKVGRYSAEVRKERIHRYRAKRNQRNFNKTIKYACRKTLADTRARIRGRFVRSDEARDIPKAASFNGFEYEDDLWID